MAWRRLKRNESSATARTLIFVDTETQSTTESDDNTGPNKLTIGAAASGRVRKLKGKQTYCCRDDLIFNEPNEFWEWVKTKSRPKETTWIFAHNVSFDSVILDLVGMLVRKQWRVTKPYARRDPATGKEFLNGMFVIDGPPFILSLQDPDGCRYLLADTLNYWRRPLEQLGRSAGIPKLPMPSPSAEAFEWRRYCMRDVRIIEHAVVELLLWWREQDLGNWRWTAPSLAMAAFRHKFMTHDIIFHDEPKARQLERAAYFGGQTEAYFLGPYDKPVWQYDVVSLYPKVMQDELYPSKLLDYREVVAFTEAMPMHEPSAAIAQVEVDLRWHTLPHRTPAGPVYATGRGTMVLAGPELHWAVENGLVRRWGSWATYKLEPLFREFVEYFAPLKEHYTATDEPIKREFVKMVMNSLYGKFGQYGGKWRINPNRVGMDSPGLFREVHPFTRAVTLCLEIGDAVFDKVDGLEVEQAFPAISAFVCAHGRQYMRRLRGIAGPKNVLYQATDSLMVSEAGRGQIHESSGLLGDTLGKLQLQRSGHNADIIGLNWYRIGDEWVRGGRKKTARHISDTVYSQLHFDSFVQSLCRMQREQSTDPAVLVQSRTIHRSRDYWKARQTPSGWLKPWSLEQLNECR